ncbi:hypothetical protein PFISCL1PPCAC_21739, partial [Pristionchus fissidentatus]
QAILGPVFLCIILTQIGWMSVYDCKTTKNLFVFESFFPNNCVITMQSQVNATFAVVVFALVSALMTSLVVFHFKKLVEACLSLWCIIVSFAIAGSIFQDGAAKLAIDKETQSAIAASMTAVYGGGAVLAFFTNRSPHWFHQVYVVS